MRQGCISSGEIHCDACQSKIPYLERYLSINEEDGVETAGGELQHYCINCCIKKGYALYREEKGEKVLTFFTE
ncbi:MAG: hypothetical protein PHQ86_04395 [Dehalococcoidales bacterium]|nr:hypothetical protein [Dehalococcoidales bacterium]